MKRNYFSLSLFLFTILWFLYLSPWATSPETDLPTDSLRSWSVRILKLLQLSSLSQWESEPRTFYLSCTTVSYYAGKVIGLAASFTGWQQVGKIYTPSLYCKDIISCLQRRCIFLNLSSQTQLPALRPTVWCLQPRDHFSFLFYFCCIRDVNLTIAYAITTCLEAERVFWRWSYWTSHCPEISTDRRE